MTEPAKAVFLSYASQDAEAARSLCEALRAAGIEVWFDQSELRGGDAWDRQINTQIHACALFIAIISAHSNARIEGYFRREWRLAVDRTHDMADDAPFLLPVVIDDTSDATARVPDAFREVQWTRLPGGATPPAFVARILHLLTPGEAQAPALSRAADGPAHVSRRRAAPAAASRRSRFVRMLIAAAVILAGGYLAMHERWGSKRSPDAGRSSAAAAQSAAAAKKAVPAKSIAVLPFENLTGRPGDAYLADGLQEEILNALARVRELTVISRTSAMVFRSSIDSARDIGRRLGVASVLEGSIRRDGDTLRLTIQLIDARDDRHLLAANYDRDLTHILGLQSAVARQVADALAATLSKYERGELERVSTNSGDAYNHFLKAVALYRRPAADDETGLKEPIRLLEEAVRLDPDYPDALALLSQAHTWRFQFDRQPVDSSSAKQAFMRALALDAELPEARLARGLYEMYVSDDLDRALEDLEAVVQLRPSEANAHATLGFALRRRGRFDDALEHLVRAWDLDPFNEAYAWGPWTTLLGLRRYPEAIEQTQRISIRFPDEPGGYIARANVERLREHSAEPLRVLLRDHGRELEPDRRTPIEATIAQTDGHYLDAMRLWQEVPTNDRLQRHLLVGGLYLAAGDRRSAESAFRDLEQDAAARRTPLGEHELAELALAQSMLDEHEAALASIDKARAMVPEARDAVNGPHLSLLRSFVLARGGRTAEAYVEVERLLHVPFGAPVDYIYDPDPARLLLASDPHYDTLINHPPRL